MELKTVVLTGGGTAGHCVPALALVPELKKHFGKIAYIGGKNGIEKRLAKEYGLIYYGVECAKLERRITLKNLAIPITLARGISEAKDILTRLKPSVVFSKGGYVSLPVVIAAERLGIPVALHESDFSLGLANKLARRYANTLMTAFKETAEKYPDAEYTGSPVRRELLRRRNPSEEKKKYGIEGDKAVLLVLGGSQGASSLNELVVKNLDELTSRFFVVLVCGKGKKSGIERASFKEIEFSSDMGSLYAAADYCVSRGGANTLAEIIELKKPSLIIPLPKGNSRGDQIENAEYYERKGAIKLLYEDLYTRDAFIGAVDKVVENERKLIAACERRVPGDSASRIVERLVEISS